MKFFLDTANLAAIESLYSLGIVSGITTNPSIISKEKAVANFDVVAHYNAINALVGASVPVSVEVLSTTSDAMYKEAVGLANLADNFVVKIPCNTEGITTIAKLSAIGIKTNCTLVFSLTQAVCAMRAGATYISPFIGRLEDIGQSGIGLIADCVSTRDRFSLPTEIICTSIRSINHIVDCIKLGSDIVTCTPDYFPKLMNHPLTDQGLEKFLTDYNSAK